MLARLTAAAALVLLGPSALAQAPEADSLAVHDPAAADSVVAVPAGPAPGPVTLPAPQPTVHAFGATGLRVTLPAGWNGPTEALDADPAYAAYAFRNALPGNSLSGAVLRVERVLGLNQLLRERWQRGQTSYGYHGTRPVGPIVSPLPGLGLEVAGAGTGGVVVFLQRGPASWAVQIEVPEAVWATRRAEVLAVLADVTIP